MAPPNDEPAEPAAEPAPLATTKPAPPPAATHADLVFLYKGSVDMCEAVELKRNAMSLRLLVKKALCLRAHPNTQIRLFSLRRGDGSWPDEDEAKSVEGAELKYTRRICVLFPNVGDADEVHFRVEVEAFVKDMNDAVSVSNKRRAASETLPFHMFDENTVNKMYKKVRQEDYTPRERPLPEELMERIRAHYADVYNALGPFPNKNEAGKRAYIDTILLPCVAYVNDQCKFVGKERLVVDMEVQLFTEGLNASGRADYVVSKGDRNMIVVEAKNADITKGTHQTKATMEAARVANKRLHRDWRTIRAICTDMQNWTFLERESGVVRSYTKYNGMDAKTPVFPENLWQMVRMMYAMLLDL